MVKRSSLEGLGFSNGEYYPSQISARICEQLRKAIIEGKLRGGEHIVESELTKVFNVSRSPVREALQTLGLEGLVEILPYKGTRVSKISVQDALDHYAMKAMMEGFAARMVANYSTSEQMDELWALLKEGAGYIKANDSIGVFKNNAALHLAIVRNVHNKRLAQMYDTLATGIKRYGSIALSHDQKEVWESFYLQHKQILQAIEDHDPVEAENLSREHAYSASKRVLEGLKAFMTDEKK
jgi:DNA-binding GntR family transcriptional regulator